jgi:glycosyltransferase involved in cell wall biosynthesis
VPFVFELRDILPESIRAEGAMREALTLGILERNELFLYKKADLIISVTHSFRDRLAERGIDATKIHIVTNGIDLKRFHKREKDIELLGRLGLEGKFIVGYIGTHGLAHSLETILDAAASMQSELRHERFRFLLLGAGARKAFLVERAKRQGLHNVIFLDSVPREEVARYWSLLDASVIHLRDSELFRSVIPSKLFECMAMGIPVLLGLEGESASLVQREGVGLLFKPQSASDLCRQVISIAEDDALRSRLSQAAINTAPSFDRSKLARRMLWHLEKLVQ